MAPTMGTSVLWCTLFCFWCKFSFLLRHPELFHQRLIHEHQGNNTIRLRFHFSYIFCGHSHHSSKLTVDNAVKRWRRRGRHAGMLVHLRRQRFCTPLHGIFLSNVRLLCSKLDELQLLLRINSDFSTSVALCFTETCQKNALLLSCKLVWWFLTCRVVISFHSDLVVMTIEKEAPWRDRHGDTVKHVRNSNQEHLTFGSSSIQHALSCSAATPPLMASYPVIFPCSPLLSCPSEVRQRINEPHAVGSSLLQRICIGGFDL